MKQADIELVIPGLLDTPVDDIAPEFLQESMPGLNYILTRANRISVANLTLDETITDSLGLGRRMLPMAGALSGSEATAGEQVMLMEAVYLKPDISNVTVYPISYSRETTQQLHELLDAVGEMFAEEMEITPVTERIFRVRFKTLNAPDYYPHPLSVLGKTINGFIEKAKADLDWYRLVTEMQMFLHDHPVNQQRQSNGDYPINSFWFWGGGSMPEGSTDQVVYSDDELIRRFFESSASSVNSMAEPVDIGKPSLVIATALLSSLKSLQTDSLQEQLQDLEEKIFAPALEGIQRRGKTLRLRVGWQQDFYLHPLHSWRFWRGRQNLADFSAPEMELG